MSKDITEMGWGEYLRKLLLACSICFVVCFSVTAIYVVSFGHILASFYYWIFTNGLWLPIDYHTWFVIATIPILNVAIFVIAIWCVVLKYTIVVLVVDVLPFIVNSSLLWLDNIADNVRHFPTDGNATRSIVKQ